MSFLDKIKAALARFFQGRNGTDELSLCTFVTGFVLQLLDMFIGTGILSLAGTALYIYSLFRMFSRNIAKRREENRRYTMWMIDRKVKNSQAIVRLKNSRQYKYFKCPQCKSWLRLKRGIGEGTVTCSKCRHSFRKKA